MAVQAIWSGTISFSLVAIPVRLVKAIEPGRVSFHLLHKKDHSRLSRKMFCSKDNAMVSRDEIEKGYEILPDKYLVVTDEELASMSPERSRTIEILEFIDMHEIDPIYYDRPYYLVPSKGGEKAYQLLVEVLGQGHKGGLAKFVLAEREYLVVVFSKDGALALSTLHYSADVLPDKDYLPEKIKKDKEQEKRMRKSIEKMIQEFRPEKYANERTKKMREHILAKVKDKKIFEAPVVEEEEEEAPTDLVSQLEESMQKVKAR